MWHHLDRPLPVDPLRRSAVLVWTHLPLVTVVGAVVAYLWSTARGSVVAAPVACLGVIPLLTVLAGGIARLLRGGEFGLADYVRALPRGLVTAWVLLAPAAIAMMCAVAADAIWAATGQRWMLLSVGVAIGVALVAGCAGLAATVIAAQHRLTVSAACRHVSAVLSRRPLPILAFGAALVLAGWASQYLALALLVLLSIPLAIVWAIAADATGEPAAAGATVDA